MKTTALRASNLIAHFSLLLLVTMGMLGCTSKPAEANGTSGDSIPTTAAAKPDTVVPAASDIPALVGLYVGAFEASKYHKGKNPSYSNRITVSIDHIGGDKVNGHSVVAGSLRPFTGTYTLKDAHYHVEAAEPGDDKYDGKFSFVLNPEKKTVSGTWTANDPNLSVYERKYTLEAKTFAYDPDLNLPLDVAYEWLYTNQDEWEWDQTGERVSEDVIKFNPSKEKLKKEDIENMYKGDLEIMRNSIYARHGYSFKNRKMRYVFDRAVAWYIPVSTDVSKELTPLEEENIALLKRYEEHAEAYYDSFGR